METRKLYSWDLSSQEALALQKKLASKVILKPQKKLPKLIAGADISFSKHTTKAYACIIFLNFKTLDVLDKFFDHGEIFFPYVPGLLSFREAPLLLKLFQKIKHKPDAIFFDGHGIAHPRGMGLASHLGLVLNIPTIGCAKSKLYGSYQEPAKEKGSVSILKNSRKKIIGSVIRSRNGCKPIFVSPGHLIDFKQSVNWTLGCITRYRIPEPTRLAHQDVTQYKNNFEGKKF